MFCILRCVCLEDETTVILSDIGFSLRSTFVRANTQATVR